MLYLTFEYKSETSTVATCIHVSLLYKNNNSLVYNSVSLDKKRCKHGFGQFHLPLNKCCSSFDDFSLSAVWILVYLSFHWLLVLQHSVIYLCGSVGLTVLLLNLICGVGGIYHVYIAYNCRTQEGKKEQYWWAFLKKKKKKNYIW